MLQKTHFELFGLPARFTLDTALLDANYRKLQGEIHPDRFAAAPPAERLRAMQWATQVNEAYRTLKSPVARARYLLQLRGIDTQEDSNTAMPIDFLMRQMEWREAIANARASGDIEALESLRTALRRESTAMEQDLQVDLDELGNLTRAAETVRKLCFIDKVRDEIAQAIEAIEQ